MQVAKKVMIELFKSEYPDAIYRKFSDEGLNSLVDYIEAQETNEIVKLNYTPKDLYESYEEDTLNEFIVFYDLDVEIHRNWSESEQQAAIKTEIQEYLKKRDALVGFTNANSRVVYCSNKAG